MMEQYFGIKELYQVTLRAKTPMQFGERYIEAEEPVLYFENVSMAVLNEQQRPIMARGGWANLPHVIWEDRSEVNFSMQEGVLSSVGMGILMSANVMKMDDDTKLYVPMREEFDFDKTLDINNGTSSAPRIVLQHWPIEYPTKKIFIFEYNRHAIQKKIYGKLIKDSIGINGEPEPTLELYYDKNLQEPADDNDKHYLVDYYYEYEDKALTYLLQKERFNGLFTLEGKFYSKDENEGKNYTNIIYMPKVRIMSDINLRLGERANPTVATFNIVGLPENMGGMKKSVILEITRLNDNIDEED